MTTVVVNDQNNWHFDIDGEQVFQEGDEVFLAHVVPQQVRPLAGADIQRPKDRLRDVAARGRNRICCPTQCHIARIIGSNSMRASSLYKITVFSAASTTALAICHCFWALSGSVLVGMAKRGRPQLKPILPKRLRTVLGLSQRPRSAIPTPT